MAVVEWLHHGRLSRDVAGAKGSALSDLHAAGFPVPEGFVVTAEGYRHLLASSGLDTRIEELLGSATAIAGGSARDLAATISSLILQAKPPPDLAYQIASAYEVLATANGARVAVRASATDEHGATASARGLYDSYLNVRGTASVQESISKCIASYWSEPAITSRSTRSSDGIAAMSVVVMSLVSGDTSGIALTAHPQTGDRDVVLIKATWGMGEPIVSGSMTPDSFVVRRDTLDIVERVVALKATGVYPHTDNAGTYERPLDPAQAAAPSLTDAQAMEIGRMALAIAQHCGTPQAVEWTMSHGRLFILQAKAITTSQPQP